jgi:peroxiredoxin
MFNRLKPGTNRVLVIFFIGLFLISVIGMGGYLLGGHRITVLQASHSSLSIGSKAPDFKLININGEPIKLSDLRGHPILINFWATWCGPCVLEMPLIQDRYQEYSTSLMVLAVDADEPYDNIRDFVYDTEITFEVLQDPDGRIQGLYNIQGYPTSFFIDTEGIIRAIQIGGLTGDQIDKDLLMIGVGK